MKSTLFIPKTINVGYQELPSTYTGKLAYIIYTDEKGVLRKEASWQSWRNKNIEPDTFNNEPIYGFVLNKKVGDYVSHWNHRQAYVRVYDPRNFEFEITIENLLHILENTSSIKGKGLEGEFVYAWDGKNLVLLSTESADYKHLKEYNDIVYQNTSFKVKDMKIGGEYLTKNNEIVYWLGRHDFYDYDWKNKKRDELGDCIYDYFKKGKRNFFARLSTNNTFSVFSKTNLNFIIKEINSECHSEYHKMFEKLITETEYSPPNQTKFYFEPLDYKTFESKIDNVLHSVLVEGKKWRENFTFISSNKKYEECSIVIENNKLVGFKTKTKLKKEQEDWTGKRVKYETTEFIAEDVFTIKELYEKYKPIKQICCLENGEIYKVKGI